MGQASLPFTALISACKIGLHVRRPGENKKQQCYAFFPAVTGNAAVNQEEIIITLEPEEAIDISGSVSAIIAACVSVSAMCTCPNET